MQLALGHFSDTDVLRTRLMLEEWVADAARYATAEDYEALRGILDQMDGLELTARDFNRLDTEFQVRIAEFTGNSLDSYLMSSLRRPFTADDRCLRAVGRLACDREGRAG